MARWQRKFLLYKYILYIIIVAVAVVGAVEIVEKGNGAR